VLLRILGIFKNFCGILEGFSKLRGPALIFPNAQEPRRNLQQI
jgi:hypothetical protein